MIRSLTDKEKEWLKKNILTLPGLREAIKNYEFEEAFRIIYREIKMDCYGGWDCYTAVRLLGESLYLSGVDFLSHMNTIPHELFWHSKIVDKIVIPPSITTIEDMAFLASDLDEVDFDSVTQNLAIGSHAFADCPLKEVYLPREAKNWNFGAEVFGNATVYCYFTEKELNKKNRLLYIKDGKFEWKGSWYTFREHLINPTKGRIFNLDQNKFI